MEYRIATDGDIERMMQARMDTLRAVNRLEDGYRFTDGFQAASRAYFMKGDQTTVLALDGERTVGCATMCYMEMMPTFSHPSGKRAHLMNVYTDPARRREGIACRMVTMLIDEAWNRGATEISLDATEAGRPLYRQLGFRDSRECMVLEKEPRGSCCAACGGSAETACEQAKGS